MAPDSGDYDRGEFLFHNLIAMFATLALQQLGKLVNPLTGEVERDLRQARITIDMLEMIRAKTAGNLMDEERRHLDTVLMELHMNWIDESGKPEEEPEAAPDAAARRGADPETGTKRDTADRKGETTPGT